MYFNTQHARRRSLLLRQLQQNECLPSGDRDEMVRYGMGLYGKVWGDGTPYRQQVLNRVSTWVSTELHTLHAPRFAVQQFKLPPRAF